MKSPDTHFKKTVLSVALVAALGTSAPATAQTLAFNWTGLMTLMNFAGTNVFANTSYPYYDDPTWDYGKRTPISGTLSIDTETGSGSATMMTLDWGNGTAPWQMYDMTLQALDDGLGNPGSLILGNMLYDWSGNEAMPVSMVWDAAGLFGALQTGFDVGTVISGTGAVPASNGIFNDTVQIGPSPMAMTSWNTTLVGPACTDFDSCQGRNPSGGLPLIADSIGGSPMEYGPWYGMNLNLDITTLTVTAVPIPAAVWLFGSGLLGLLGLARRKAP